MLYHNEIPISTEVRPRRPSWRARRCLAPLAMLTSGLFLLVALVPQESHALALTLLAVILGGKMAISALDRTVDGATSDVRDTVDHTKEQVEALIKQLETTYDGALNTTLDSLDGFTSQQLSKLAGLFDQINNKVMDDWSVVQGDVLQLLHQVDGTIRQTLGRMEDLIVVGVRGATFVIDKTTYNVAFLLAIVMMAIGLLMFVRLLWTAKRPEHGGIRVGATALMGVYLAFCSALLVPQARAYAITMVGQAKELEQIGSGPHLFTMTPNRLITGEPGELVLVGANFDGGGAPKVMLGGKAITPASWSADHIVVKIAGPTAKLSGPQTVAVRTADGEVSNGLVAHFQARPQPTKILSWYLWPTGQKADLSKESDPRGISWVCPDAHRFVSKSWPVTLGGDWSLDRTRQATFKNKSLSNRLGEPGADVGFVENVTKHEVLVKGEMYRTIEYLPSGHGIEVKLHCKGAVGVNIKYTLHGRKYVTRDGAAISGGAFEVTGSGIKTVATYPKAKLADFRNQQPELFHLKVQLRSSSGEQVEREQVFIPGTPAILEFDGLKIWMENEAVKVNRPGGSLTGPAPAPNLFEIMAGWRQELPREVARARSYKLSR